MANRPDKFAQKEDLCAMEKQRAKKYEKTENMQPGVLRQQQKKETLKKKKSYILQKSYQTPPGGACPGRQGRGTGKKRGISRKNRSCEGFFV